MGDKKEKKGKQRNLKLKIIDLKRKDVGDYTLISSIFLLIGK